MDSSSVSYDRLSSLPDLVLVMILSYLPFKECVRTSALGKRWRNLYHESRNISFKESEHVSRALVDEFSIAVARTLFVCNMRIWASRFQGQVIDTFELCLSSPVNFSQQISLLINFVVSKNVKKLILDFSHPNWRTFSDASGSPALSLKLPESVYSHSTLVSLKIYACRFDPSRFVNPGLLRNLSIGYVDLRNVETLISKSPLLESLNISFCWGLDIVDIAGNMREFAFVNCDFLLMSCAFDLPNVDIFKYSGDVFCFHFERMNKVIKQVHLDFKSEGEYDEPTISTKASGEVISGYLNSLKTAVTLSVCPFLLQTIPESEPPHLLYPVKTQHLVLRTRLHPKEFMGIRMLLHNCPDLETLTFDIQPSNRFEKSFTYAGINPQTFWMESITYRCLRKTLKVVVVKNYGGRPNEVNVLKYLIQSGRGREYNGRVLEKVDIYLRDGLEDMQLMVAQAGAEMLQNLSYRVQVLLHTP